MVNIDTVYQKVLALANKEQRGYITPQEYNLFASKAQIDIINNYFHAEKMAQLKPTKNQTESSDEIEMIQEKLAYLLKETQVPVQIFGSVNAANYQKYITLPLDVYKIATIYDSYIQVEVEEVTQDRLFNLMKNPLTEPTVNRPVYINRTSITQADFTQDVSLAIYPTLGIANNFKIKYYKKPPNPNWAYVVASQKALYNFNNSVNFDLHPMEEEPLVTRILQLSGIAMQRQDVSTAATLDKQAIRQEQNS